MAEVQEDIHSATTIVIEPDRLVLADDKEQPILVIRRDEPVLARVPNGELAPVTGLEHVVVGPDEVSLVFSRSTQLETGCSRVQIFLPRDRDNDAILAAARGLLPPAHFVDEVAGIAAGGAQASPEEMRLVAEVLANPDDDTPRRILADHLMEVGDSRGELIMLQCDRARAGDPVQLRAIDDRLVALYRANRQTWARGIGLDATELTWERGFIDTVEARGPRILAAAPRLFATTPLRCVRPKWQQPLPALEALCALPWPRTVTALALRGAPAPEAYAILARAPFMKQLVELDLASYQLGDTGLAALVSAGDALRRLAIAHDEFTGDGIARLVAARPWTRLRFVNSALDSACAREIATCGNLRSLDELDLADNYLCQDDVVALATSPHLRAVRKLTLDEALLDTDGMAAVGRMPGLRSLSLWCCGVDGKGIRALAQNAGKLEALNLGNNSLGGEGVGAIVECDAFAGVRELVIDGSNLTAADALALLRAHSLRGLRSLDLSRNRLGWQSAELATEPALARLTELRLRQAGLESGEIQALARRADLGALRRLDLSNNPIDDAGALALARAPSLDGLELLDLQGAKLGMESRAALVARFGDAVRL